MIKRFNRGFTGKGKFNTSDESYCRWKGMFYRCYGELDSYNTGHHQHCEVEENWYDFQKFAEWFHNNKPVNYKSNHKLDKDLLVKGNSTYGVNYCCIIPNRINTALMNKRNKDDLPMGITRTDDNKDILRVRCSNHEGKSIHLGTTRDINEALLWYKEFKEHTLARMAEQYYNDKQITEKAYLALLSYQV